MQRLCLRSVIEERRAITSNGDEVEDLSGDSAHLAGVFDLCGETKWGVWEAPVPNSSEQNGKPRNVGDSSGRFLVRLCIGGQEVCGQFPTREAAESFQLEQLTARLSWPRQPLPKTLPDRSPTWDHPEELEPLKEYTFLHARSQPGSKGGAKLTDTQVQQFNSSGFLLSLPVLSPEELVEVRREFEELLRSRIEGAPSDESRFRAAHTISRPLHQDLVARLAKHKEVLSIVEDIVGSPRFVCWSAHLFCKLPGDPTEQPWHQDAGFWPLSRSRALTVWIAFDEVDASNSGVTFVEGSHRLGRIPWQPTDTESHLLTQQIPDVDLLGRLVQTELQPGEASVHCDLTVHGSLGNASTKRRAGLALRFVAADAECIGPMINGYTMNGGCILPKGPASDPKGHWKSMRRRPGGKRAPRFKITPKPQQDGSAE